MKNFFLTILSSLSILIACSQGFTLIHDGIERTYILHLPQDYDTAISYPLIINMHGLGSNAFEQEVYTAMDQVADTAGFIVAYPNGINNTWNISSNGGTDDVGFISALIDTLNAFYSIDLQRVYATGMSMGGFMSYRLACQLADRIAAIASVAGLQAYFPCNPDRPVPVLHFHGTADPVVPYAGVPATITNWVDHNGCPSDPVVTDLPDIDTTDNSTVTEYYYGPGQDSSEVVLYSINNGEHTWPGASILIGITNQDIDASVEIWNFFSKFTLQGSTGIEAVQQSSFAFNIYPNPVHGYATVEVLNNNIKYNDFGVSDLTGRIVVEKKQVADEKFAVDLSSLPPGIYIAGMNNGSSKTFRKLIIR